MNYRRPEEDLVLAAATLKSPSASPEARQRALEQAEAAIAEIRRPKDLLEHDVENEGFYEGRTAVQA